MQTKSLQMKRALRTALLVLLLSAVGMTKGYAYDFSAVCETGQTLYYNITDATNHYVGLTYPGNSGWEGFTKPTGNIVLPETVQYNGVNYIVTSISPRAFSYCSDLTGNLIIPNSVTAIGFQAFFICSGFTGCLTISNSVTTIGTWAFLGCSGFTGNLSIGNSVATIGDSAFGGCSGFTGNLIIPNSVTSIGNGAFNGCSSFTGNLIIPNSVISIGDNAFEECIGLSGNLTIPNSVTSIGTNPFSCCWGLEYINVASDNPVYDSRNNCNAIIETNTNSLISGCMNSTIPNTVTIIGNYAFDRCLLGGSLTIPNSVTTIGNYAFCNCSMLTSLTIPNSVTTIGDYAFSDCYSLTLLSIPNSVTYIGINPFACCSGLEHIEVASDNPVYDSRNNCNAIIETNANELITGCKNSTIPNSVTLIGSDAFICCTRLTTINIPNSVASIGNHAFHGCSGLTSITILAETPPFVGAYAFSSVDPAIPVTVPCGFVSVYEASDWHTYFTAIVEDCSPHDVIIDENSMNGGNVSTSVNSSNMGEEVQINITPDEGMMLASLIVSNANDPAQTIPVYSIGKNSLIYGFLMPPFDVIITATFGPVTAISENNETLALVYPNPTNGQIKIEAEDLKHITISNMLGQTIYDGNDRGNEFSYDFSNQETGFYLIRIETAKGVAVKKVSVTR